ncbi:acyltransferase family protein [Chloroflexota bacterium]
MMTGKSDLSSENRTDHVRLVWLELIKAIALIWIFLNHIVEQIFGYPHIANPSANWPPFEERLAQLQLLAGYGLWSVPVNLLRYVGWAGDQGVNLFLIISGFGLTWGLLTRYGKSPFPLGPFYRRRAERVYPLWWGVHLLFIASWILVGWGLSLTDPATYLSMLGLRVTSGVLYYFSPAWWYIGLLLQLYLVYPLLWAGLRRHGPLWLLVISCLIAFPIRALGLLFFEGYLDAWSRGAIFITRLPEFVFGISLAAWLYYSPKQTDRRLRAPLTLFLATVGYIIGTFLSLSLLGMTIAPFLLGVAIFIILFTILNRKLGSETRKPGIGVWIGWHSYSLYLLHHPIILALLPVGLAINSPRTLVRIIGVAILTVVGAVALEISVGWGQAALKKWYKNLGLVRIALRIAALGLVTVILLITGEILVRWWMPQEAPQFGWGERASLKPHSTFGWHLKPSQETRLRWESYDYTVTANSLGFPGLEYPKQKGPQTLRIMTTGDAFTSAEGVDTDQAWPRLLETELASKFPGNQVEVLNFAITGYGPNQYAAVIEQFAPIYQPDLIIVGFFVNEYQDVLRSNADFQQSIGFHRPAQDGLYSIASLSHLRRLVRLQWAEPLAELLRNKPRDHGYFLGNFLTLERNQPSFQGPGRQMVVDRFQQIKEVADSIDAEVIIAMIPAPVQVCGPGQLAYYPRQVDLTDSTQFDLEQPQRLTQKLATSLKIGYYDLRPVLRSVAESCPYQPHNMHWTAAGHSAVAAYLAEVLANSTDKSASVR